MSGADWVTGVLGALGFILGVLNFLPQRKRDARLVNVWASWGAHQFPNEAEQVDAIHIRYANNGQRPVGIRRAGYAWSTGRSLDGANVEGIRDKPLTADEDAEISLHQPSASVVERFGWPTQVFIEDANENRYYAEHPHQWSPYGAPSDGDF